MSVNLTWPCVKLLFLSGILFSLCSAQAAPPSPKHLHPHCLLGAQGQPRHRQAVSGLQQRLHCESIQALRPRAVLAHGEFYLLSELPVPVHKQICFCLKTFPHKRLPSSEDCSLRLISKIFWNRGWDYIINSVSLSEAVGRCCFRLLHNSQKD